MIEQINPESSRSAIDSHVEAAAVTLVQAWEHARNIRIERIWLGDCARTRATANSHAHHKENLAMLAIRERTQPTWNDVAVVTKTKSTKCFLDPQVSTQAEGNPRERRSPKVPQAREEKKERLPRSFDELAAHLDQEFGRLAAEIEQMAQELREAEKRSEQLRHKLLQRRSF